MNQVLPIRLILLFAVLAMAPSSFAESIVTPAMAGHWEGKARIVVVWCQQKSLPVAVDIGTNGIVTGKIGDAQLVNGRFEKNRGWFGRKLNLWTDYIIKGRLDGAVVVAEGIKRDGVFVPLNFIESSFRGGVNTTGTHIGGKEKMVLTAGGLTLTRAK